MKAAGSADASFHVRSADTGAGRGESLRAGAFVFIEVRERLGPELYRIAVGSRLLTASSKAVLEPGALLRAKVERSSDGFLLRMLDAGRGPRDAAAQAILKAGLPLDEASRVALAALLGAGMPPEGAALGRVRRAALRAAGREDESGLVELAARMEAKGQSSDDAALDALAKAGDGRSYGQEGRRGGSDDRGGAEGDRGSPPEGGNPAFASEGSSPRADAFDLERDFLRLVPEDEVPAFLGAFLRALMTRSRSDDAATIESAEDPAGVKDGGLGLFNHLKGRGRGWLLVPFRFALDSVAFAGSLRIELPYAPGGPGRMDARFDATAMDSSRTWRASLSFGGGARPTLRIAAPEGWDSDRFGPIVASLESGMAAAGCSLILGRAAGREGDVDRGGFDLDA